MKLSQFKQFLILCVGLLLIASCGGNNASRATGWDINSKSGGFQFNVEFEDQETGPGLVFIEGGTFTKGQVQDDVMHDWNFAQNCKKKIGQNMKLVWYEFASLKFDVVI